MPGGEAPLHNIVFADEPTALVRDLRAQGIGAAQQYRFLANNPVYANLGGDGFDRSRRWEAQAVYLPFGLGLTPEDARRIGHAVRATGHRLHRLRAGN